MHPIQAIHAFPAFHRAFLTGLFNEFPEVTTEPKASALCVDIRQTETAYELKVDMPGVPAENVTLDIEGDTLVLGVAKKSEEAQEENGWVRRERRFENKQRRFNLPETVDRENVKATLKDGVLTLTLPFKPAVTPKTIPVIAA